MASANRKAAITAARKPWPSAVSDSWTSGRSRLLQPSAAAMIAKYSGPTTIAPMTRIWELVRIPTAAISPAMTSRR
jgi:hypothetical protein